MSTKPCFRQPYRETRTSCGGLNFRSTDFTVVVLLQGEKRKLRNHVRFLVRTERLIKQSIKLFLTEKMMRGPLKLKDAMLQIKVIQRKALCQENVEEIQL